MDGSKIVFHEEKMVPHNRNSEIQKQVEAPNRLVKFDLKKEQNPEYFPFLLPQNSGIRAKRALSLTEGILKKRSIFKKTDSRLKRTCSEDNMGSKISAHSSTHGNEQDCSNVLYNNGIKSEFFKKYNQSTFKNSYRDEYFPPNFSSLFDKNPDELAVSTTSKIVWKRITDIFPPSTFDLVLYSSEQPSSFNFITKGSQLCPDYLIQSLNCIRYNMLALQKIFDNQSYNQNGIYHVSLFHDGKWQTVIIDDYIPVLPRKKKSQLVDTSQPTTYKPILSYISHSKNKKKNKEVQIWHYLIEKAYAKYYSSYGNILEGNTFDFMWDITGEVCESCLSRNDSISWKNINPALLAIGLTEGLKKVPLTFHPNKERVSFMNAGKDNWKQTIWPQDIPSLFPYVYIWCNKIFNYWGSVQIRQPAKGQTIVRTFQIHHTCNCSLITVQKDKRFFPKHMQYKYSWMRIVLLQKQLEKDYRWIDGVYSNTRILKLQTRLEPGKYYVLLLPQWKSKVNQFSLVIKSQTPTQLMKENYQENCLEKGCADMAQRFGKLNQLNRNLCSYNCIHEEMGMIIENINNEKMMSAVKIRRSIMGLKPNMGQAQDEDNVTIEAFNKEFKDGESLQIEVNPGGEYTVVLLMKGGINKQFFQGFNFRNKIPIEKPTLI